MANSTATQGRRASRLPLSSVMVDLLRALMEGIDRRHSLFTTTLDAVEDEGLGIVSLIVTVISQLTMDSVPATCECCHGIGFVLLTEERSEEPPASPTAEDGEEEANGGDAGDANVLNAPSAPTYASIVATCG
ncbi:hypothetical protein NMY22_g14674 [Coprinellus aureogranulatus]|nr:hypothetical protein NMY22_g14674 [Coprinellus aureogranulatus]